MRIPAGVASMASKLFKGRFTITAKLQALVLPAASCVVHVTILVPGGKTLPLTGAQVTIGEGPQKSVAVHANVTGTPAGPALSTARFVEQVITGATAS